MIPNTHLSCETRRTAENREVKEKVRWGRGEGWRTNLHLNIQNHNRPARRQLPNRPFTRPIPVPAKLRILHKCLLLDHLLKLRHADVVVVHIARLAGSRVACCMRDRGCEDGGVPLEQELVECPFAYA
jgi:hypothetical protein